MVDIIDDLTHDLPAFISRIPITWPMTPFYPETSLLTVIDVRTFITSGHLARQPLHRYWLRCISPGEGSDGVGVSKGWLGHYNFITANG